MMGQILLPHSRARRNDRLVCRCWRRPTSRTCKLSYRICAACLLHTATIDIHRRLLAGGHLDFYRLVGGLVIENNKKGAGACDSISRGRTFSAPLSRSRTPVTKTGFKPHPLRTDALIVAQVFPIDRPIGEIRYPPTAAGTMKVSA